MNQDRIFFSLNIFLLLTITILLSAVFIDGKGGDYAYFLPKMLDTHFFYKLNGLTLQEYTAAYCGGIFVFANPQSISLSIPQILLFFLDPVNSIRVTYIFSNLIGMLGFFLVSREYGLTKSSALFSSAIFSLSAFLIVRMIVGHVAFYSIAFAPIVAYFLIFANKKISAKKYIDSSFLLVIASLIVSYVLYSGIAAVFPHFVYIFILLVAIYGLKNKQVLISLVTIFLVLSLSFFLALPKIEASYSLVNNIPRDFYQLGGFSNFLDIFAYLFSSIFLIPDVEYTNSLFATKNYLVDFPELTYSVSPFFFMVLTFILLKKVRKKFIQIVHSNKWVFIVSLASFAMVVSFHFYNPQWINFLNSIPVIGQSSSMFRWNYILIPIISLLGGVIHNIWSTSEQKRSFFITLYIILSSAFLYLSLDKVSEMSFYDPHHIVKAWESSKQDNVVIPEINSIGLFQEKDKNGNIKIHHAPHYDKLFIKGISNAMCYEPLFGYRLEKSNMWKLNPGDIFKKDSREKLNFNNPSCYVYPQENFCKAGDRFRDSEKDLLTKLASRDPVSFKYSKTRILSNDIALWTLLLSIIILLFKPIMLVINLWKK